ncbi:MAG: hypothetical protein WA733_04080 [Methylocystis sp.]
MTMTTTPRKDARPTLHSPTKKDKAPAPAKIAAPATKTLTIPKPLNPERGVVETSIDVSVDLEPQHRRGPPRRQQALDNLAKSLIELTRDVPLEPRDTRSLRLALAVVALAPECPTAFLTNALKSYAAEREESERLAAEELRRAIFRSVNSARLIRFKPMFESAIAVVEQRRVEAAGEQLSKEGCEHATGH